MKTKARRSRRIRKRRIRERKKRKRRTTERRKIKMGTLVKEKVGVSVNVMEKSVTFMVNTLFNLMLRILNARGLRPDHIIGNREIIENGFFTWLAEETLERLHLEIIAPDGTKALERWDISFEYSAVPDLTVRKPPVEELAEIQKKLRSLPRGTCYRIVVHTKPGASPVKGWYPTTLKPFTAKREETFARWGYGHIGGQLYYREGTWDGKDNV
jgi:hypothetical protein